MPDEIRIIGACQHNLQNIDVALPREALVVITGLSGSGKSSLAFDTLYAEGQRRYVESLSAYARQFLDRLQKPKVERIEGLSPAIAIEQRTSSSNPRSTVGTTTEIYDYVRLLYAHIGVPHCPKCGKEVEGQSAQAICNHIGALPPGRKLMLLAPYIRGRKGEHRDVIDRMRRDGFVRIRVDGRILSLDDEIELDRNRRHTLEAVVDRLITGNTSDGRLNDSVELTLRLGEGVAVVLTEDPDREDGWAEETMSEHLACESCGISFGQLEPRNFSFNSPYGACKECHGLGSKLAAVPELVIPDPSLSIRKGAIPMWRRGPKRLIMHYNRILRRLAEYYDFSLSTPWEELPESVQDILLYGTGSEKVPINRRRARPKVFEGILANLLRRHATTESNAVRERLRQRMKKNECPGCRGARLLPKSLGVTVGGVTVHELCTMSIDRACEFMSDLRLTGEKETIAGEIVKEIRERLDFLRSVGLNYLTMNRESGTLSGGEAHRIRLATQVGSGLVGVVYILDEPTIGLHQRDNARLLGTLERLRDQGNTVVVVEHDPLTMQRADFIVDLGPRAGRHGGRVVCAGTPKQICDCPDSITGQFMTGKREVPIPESRAGGNGAKLSIIEAAEHNLKKIDVEIPLGTFCCVTGVSGSGKSTLVDDILKNAVRRELGLKSDEPGKHRRISGMENIDKLIVIDQSPIGRTPRSNPATYTDAFTSIRKLFSKVPESRVRGYKPGRFSFNVKGGRCEECRGDGTKKIEMQFLPDVYVECEICNGKRYNRETLGIRYRGKTISEVLEMTVDEARTVFKNIPRLKKRFTTLSNVGLGYIHLGQPATTLSGGEAQRVKLATELAKRSTGHTLYILDEPTTGLHPADVEKLLKVLCSLRDQGNTVLIIEHNLDIIKVADHLIDLGPEGGDAGGEVVISGPPELVAECPESHTGNFLKKILDGKRL